MRANDQPKIGRGNLHVLFPCAPGHVQVNSVTIEPETQKEQELKRADIGDLDQDEETNNPKVDSNEEETVTLVTANKIPKKRACPPYEVIQVQTENGTFPIVIIYDTGSEVTLCNYETGLIVIDTKRDNKKITISTVNSIQAKLR